MHVFLAGLELSLFLCLYAGADEETHVHGLRGCPGLHKGLAGRCRGTRCAGSGLLAGLRGHGSRDGGDKSSHQQGKATRICLKKSTGHKK